MGDFLYTQNVFSCGEISPEFYAINNIHGVSKLENIDVLQSGGLKRRDGLLKVKSIPDNSILVPFIINESEKYLLVIYQESIDIYSNDTKIASVIAPWADTDLSKLQYAQRFNNMFFVHPDYQPYKFVKDNTGFHILRFDFYTNQNMSVNMPFTRFEDTDDISITISASDIDNNHATFTTSADMWSNKWIGVRLIVDNRQWVIESFQDARVAIARTNGAFTLPGEAIYDWSEVAFSNARGWPCCVSFHQNRLVFAGTYSMPNSVWMSKTGMYNNFDTGTGLDDEAIYLTLLSAQHHQISTLISSDNLQILTSVGEWAISNSPLTPENVNIKQHTSVGSVITRYLPPQQIEGRTVFISKSCKDIRELDMDMLNQTYNAVDLCLYSKHLMSEPVSIAYNQSLHRLYVVMQDGNMAVLNKYSNTEISAWGTYKTDGLFKYVCVIDNNTYVIVNRQNQNYLEKFDNTCLCDSETYNFSCTVSALPMIVNGHAPKKIRARKINLRLKNTKTCFVNGKRIELPNDVYEAGHIGYSGDVSINLLGFQFDTMVPLWSVSTNEQLPITILSVTVEGCYSI